MAETSTSEHEQLLSEYGELWNGDFSKGDAVSESVVIHEPAGEIRGREDLEDRIREVRSGFPDFHITVDDMLVSDEVVMMEWTMTGTHEGEYRGIPPTDREMTVSGMSKFRITDNKVQEEWMYFDRQEMFDQLGLGE